MKKSALVSVAIAGCLLLSGCTGSGSAGSSKSATKSSAATASGGASATPTFGSDVSVPADGVGEVRATDVDEWTLVNRADNVYARVVAPAAGAPLEGQLQTQVISWLSQYRSATSPTTEATSTQSVAPSSPMSTGSVPSSSVSSGSASRGTASTSPAGSSGSTTSATATASDGTVGASGGTSAADTKSLRVLSQLLAASSDVMGVRLYAQLRSAQGVTEHWQSVWFDPDANRIVEGSGLFATPVGGQADPVGTARRLVGQKADVRALSDRDLFGAAAFTTTGDLVLYLPSDITPGSDTTSSPMPSPASGTTSPSPTASASSGAKPSDSESTGLETPGSVPVVIPRAEVDPLLSSFGKRAQLAAADAVVPRGAGSKASQSPTSATASATPTQTITTTAPSSSPSNS